MITRERKVLPPTGPGDNSFPSPGGGRTRNIELKHQTKEKIIEMPGTKRGILCKERGEKKDLDGGGEKRKEARGVDTGKGLA